MTDGVTGVPLLSVRNLSIHARAPHGGEVEVLKDFSADIDEGESFGLVGESGSGKTILSLALMGLLPNALRASGEILFEGEDLVSSSEDRLCEIRGDRIGMIFQEPATALNPAMTVGDQIAEGLVWHRGASWRQARADAVTLLDRVRVADAGRKALAFPHELSGGQRQRVGIAIAIALHPRLLIADEPTTALDVTVQAEILAMLEDLVKESGMGLLLVSHDLGVIARMTRRMAVLYAGRRMEEGPTEAVLRTPLSPYTNGLLQAMPRRQPGRARLTTIPGMVPKAASLPPGCAFAQRCPRVIADCRSAEPAWRRIEPPREGRGVRCIRAAGEHL